MNCIERISSFLFQIDTSLDCCQFPSSGSMITGNGGLNIKVSNIIEFCKTQAKK